MSVDKSKILKFFGIEVIEAEIDYTSVESGKRYAREIGFPSMEIPLIHFDQDSSSVSIASIEPTEKSISNLALEKKDVTYKNSDKEHCSDVLFNMIKTSDEDVLIYDRDLSGDLLDHNSKNNLFIEFENYLKNSRGRRIEVIIPEEATIDQNLVAKLKKASGGNKNIFSIYQIDSKKICEKPSLKTSPFFAVSDSRATRIEKVRKFSDHREAFYNFNNHVAPKYVEVFKKLRAVSSPL